MEASLNIYKVTFADGSFVVVEAVSEWKATQQAKGMHNLTTVDAQVLTGFQLEIGKRQLGKGVIKS